MDIDTLHSLKGLDRTIAEVELHKQINESKEKIKLETRRKYLKDYRYNKKIKQVN